MSRIKRPMYCICRRLASWLLMRFASSTASSRSSASAIDLNCVSGSPTSATPSACSSCISRFLRVLLTISSCTRCYHSAPMPKRHGFSCDPGELRSLAQVVLERARHAGANGCDCDVSEAYGLTVTVRKGQPDTIEHNRDRSVGVSIYLGERPKVRRGHASTSDFSRAALEQTVDAALAIARHTAEDECAGLPDAELLTREQPDLDLFHPWGLSTAVARLGARKIATCQAPVLFEAPAALQLIGHFVSAVNGGNLYRKTSFLVDSLGRQVFSPLVRIDERPHEKQEMASTPFDEEGVATHSRAVVRGGVVEGYFLGSYSARKLGLKTTGNAGGHHNLVVRSEGPDFAGMLKKLQRGLLVTELMGQGVNLVTGDYSRGAAGYWVEGGEIRHPVEEITIAGNLKDMFRGIVAVGSDVLVRSGRSSGSILVENMTIAGD